jgi:prepilin signal peptidase PulO-like enzyme (type II secretory pathway)
MTMILNGVFLIIGVLAGGLINVLADDLPNRERPRRPHCPECGHVYGPSRWLALTRLLLGGKCPNCQVHTRKRALLVEIGTALLFAILPLFIEPAVDLVIYSVYVGVLILIIVIDVEYRRILHTVTFPTTIFALVASVLLTDNTLLLALAGAAAGYLFFLILYHLGRRLFGPTALGFGDVTLSMTMGAMLGLQRVFFALILGIFLAGLWALATLIIGRMNLRSHFAYGPFLAIGGIVMIIWGNEIYNWILNP